MVAVMCQASLGLAIMMAAAVRARATALCSASTARVGACRAVAAKTADERSAEAVSAPTLEAGSGRAAAVLDDRRVLEGDREAGRASAGRHAPR